MVEIIYDPKNVGRTIINSRGKLSTIRKFHLDPYEMKEHRKQWQEEVKDVDKELLKKAGPYFFNPYRKGIYYAEVQSLFLLGCAPEGEGDWHSFPVFLDKLREYFSSIPCRNKNKFFVRNCWEEFKSKSERPGAVRTKDYIGRIQENMFLLQRLTQLYPYGYKLRQVGAAIDIKRVSKEGFPHGLYYYRLSVYKNIEDALPLRDFSNFEFSCHERKFINYKFIGKTVTADKVIVQGVIL